MWVPVWIVIAIALAASRTDGAQALVVGKITFQEQADCLAFVKAHESRMPDYLRGVLNVPIDLEVEVYGSCKPNGDPA